jgi:hypothetical protein
MSADSEAVTAVLLCQHTCGTQDDVQVTKNYQKRNNGNLKPQSDVSFR